MGKSKVYFTNLRAKNNDNLQQKLERLIRKAGIANIDFDNFAFYEDNYAGVGVQ